MDAKTKADVAVGTQPRALSPKRREERDDAWRSVGKDAHDAIGDACQQWSRYTDADGHGPSQSQPTYHATFKRMVHAALGIPQATARDAMTRLELLCLAVLEEALANEILNGIAGGHSRRSIKARYRATLDITASALRPVLEAERSFRTRRAA